MDEKLLKLYKEYASTEESFAILFTKKHLSQSKGHWVNIDDSERYEMSNDDFHFRHVKGGSSMNASII